MTPTPPARFTPESFRAWHGVVSAGHDNKREAVIRLPKPIKQTAAELEYERVLRREFPHAEIMCGIISFRLPSGSRWTPDLTVWIGGDTLALLVEVKGLRHSKLQLDTRSNHAFKEAMSAMPQWKFRHAHKTLDGNWKTQESK